MSVDSRAELEKMEKAELIDALMRYGEDGFFPLELIYLKNTTVLSTADLKNCWNSIYEDAKAKDEVDGYQAAAFLMDGAELCFEKAKLFPNEAETFSFCEQLAFDLHEASESDGIGMQWDNEWMYMEVAEKIEEYLGM